MNFKVGDMVVLIRISPRSTGYAVGVREGDIGTIVARSQFQGYDWQVQFAKDEGGPCHCDAIALRKIDPPEAADGWKYCVYQPKELEIV